MKYSFGEYRSNLLSLIGFVTFFISKLAFFNVLTLSASEPFTVDKPLKVYKATNLTISTSAEPDQELELGEVVSYEITVTNGDSFPTDPLDVVIVYPGFALNPSTGPSFFGDESGTYEDDQNVTHQGTWSIPSLEEGESSILSLSLLVQTPQDISSIDAHFSYNDHSWVNKLPIFVGQADFNRVAHVTIRLCSISEVPAVGVGTVFGIYLENLGPSILSDSDEKLFLDIYYPAERLEDVQVITGTSGMVSDDGVGTIHWENIQLSSNSAHLILKATPVVAGTIELLAQITGVGEVETFPDPEGFALTFGADCCTNEMDGLSA